MITPAHRKIVHVDVGGQVLRVETQRNPAGDIEWAKLTVFAEQSTAELGDREAAALVASLCPDDGASGSA